MSLLKLLKKPKGQQPLPVRKPIALDKVKDASALIFYGSPGNKVTELFGARMYEHQYIPSPFHAAMYLEDGKFLNVGRFKEVKAVEEEFKSTRRVDVIEYKLSPKIRSSVVSAGFLDEDKKNDLGWFTRLTTSYAVTDFLRFGFKWFKPSKKDFCSENVVELFQTADFSPTDLEPYNTAPWDLVEWAEEHQEACAIKTLWVGEDWKKTFPESC